MIKLFTVEKATEKQEVQTIKPDNKYYAAYNIYLDQYYGTSIEENEDFIPMDSGEEIIMILNLPEDGDEVEDEDVFEVMQDMLYMRA